ncbi:MAG TPA: bifunctional shikimate kinase/3-dehydroquinate synthase [Gaiellaceae bacterium]
MDSLNRHVALIGFMGAGKTSVGRELAERIGRPFVDVDREIEQSAALRISEIFARRGEAEFRVLEASAVLGALRSAQPSVIALGGGAVQSEEIRTALRERATTLLLEVDVETAWERARGDDRPLAQSEEQFRELYARRRPLYEQSADAVVDDVDDAVLAAGGVHVQRGALAELGRLIPGEGRIALVADPRVAGIHGADAQTALGPRLGSTHELPLGEEAKTLSTVARLWEELTLDRSGAIAALGGGCTTDAAGFAAATYLRGIAWAPVPTSLVGQVDAAIGGKTAINLPAGKNLVGAFHWPARVIVDPALLETLPAAERREGMAEVVKTGLLTGEPVWELPDDELVRRSAAYKTAVCLRDPREAGEREVLNLGHTFAHALEAAGGYERVTHGRAVALGLLAALRLSGLPTDVVEQVLRPEPVRVDRDRAWQAMHRDKKARDGRIRLVLLEQPGRPTTGIEAPEADVRAALDALIAG